MKEWTPKPGYYLDYRAKVIEKLCRELKKGEIEVIMRHYINGNSFEDCARELRRGDLL